MATASHGKRLQIPCRKNLRSPAHAHAGAVAYQVGQTAGDKMVGEDTNGKNPNLKIERGLGAVQSGRGVFPVPRVGVGRAVVVFLGEFSPGCVALSRWRNL